MSELINMIDARLFRPVCVIIMYCCVSDWEYLTGVQGKVCGTKADPKR